MVGVVVMPQGGSLTTWGMTLGITPVAAWPKYTGSVTAGPVSCSSAAWTLTSLPSGTSPVPPTVGVEEKSIL